MFKLAAQILSQEEINNLLNGKYKSTSKKPIADNINKVESKAKNIFSTIKNKKLLGAIAGGSVLAGAGLIYKNRENK